MANCIKYDVNKNFFDQTTPKFGGVASRKMKDLLLLGMPKSFKDVQGQDVANLPDLSEDLT